MKPTNGMTVRKLGRNQFRAKDHGKQYTINFGLSVEEKPRIFEGASKNVNDWRNVKRGCAEYRRVVSALAQHLWF